MLAVSRQPHFLCLAWGALATGGGLTVWQQGLFGCGFCWRLASMSMCSGRGWWLDGLTDWMAGGCGVRFAAFRNVPFQAAKRQVSNVNTCRFGVPNGRYAASAVGWRLVVVSFFAGAMVPAFRWHWLRLAFFTWRRPCHECRRRPLPGCRPVGFCCIGRNWAAMAAWGGCRFRGECWQRLCRLAATLAIWLEPGAIRLR